MRVWVKGNVQESAQGNSLMFCSLEHPTSPKTARHHAPRTLFEEIETRGAKEKRGNQLTGFGKLVIGITPEEPERKERNYGIYRWHIQDSDSV